MYAIFFTLRESLRRPAPALSRGRSSTHYGFTLDALTLNASDFCNIRVNPTASGDTLVETNAKDKQRPLLDIIPLGYVDPLVLSIVAANIQAVLRLPTDITMTRPKPTYAYLSARRQYDAVKILKTIAAEVEGAPIKLAITPFDLCISILTYVYGESQLGGRAAVVSTNRLVHQSRERTFNRIAKICIHEVGHIFGLEHCWEPDCLMRFSKHMEQLDRLPLHYCSACEYEMARRLKLLVDNFNSD